MTSTSNIATDLDGLLNAVDGVGEETADFFIVIDVVCVANTHEQDVGW